MAGHMGDRARHPARPEGGRGGRRAKPAADRRRRSPGRSAASSKSGRTADGRPHRTHPGRHHQGQARRATCSAWSATIRSLHEVVKAELAARRQGTPTPRPAAASPAAPPSRGARRAPAAPAQGTIRAPQWTGGGVVFGPHPRNYTGKVNRKAHLQGAAGSRSRRTPPTAPWPPSTARHCRSRAPSGRRAGQRLARASARWCWSSPPTRTPSRASFRNLERTARGRGRPASRSADLVWARVAGRVRSPRLRSSRAVSAS